MKNKFYYILLNKFEIVIIYSILAYKVQLNKIQKMIIGKFFKDKSTIVSLYILKIRS